MKTIQEFKIDKIARLVHEVNRLYSQSHGDYSHLPWDQAPDWQKQSTISGVKFKIQNPEMTPEQQHEQWMQYKLNDGWIYGPVKDADKKTHPSMKPYSELDEKERIKDSLFATIVKLSM